ncbi:MAG: hypothetical protein D3903_17785, partial [Candidatus Electrothrix sp. GM3_4]|nr:hypothetical protein [Candidatus Electrothrix sp. GM3_4]
SCQTDKKILRKVCRTSQEVWLWEGIFYCETPASQMSSEARVGEEKKGTFLGLLKKRTEN